MISPETIARIEAMMAEASVFEDDLEESFILGGGPGGQKTNKTSSVVRLAHAPSARRGRRLRRLRGPSRHDLPRDDRSHQGADGGGLGL